MSILNESNHTYRRHDTDITAIHPTTSSKPWFMLMILGGVKTGAHCWAAWGG